MGHAYEDSPPAVVLERRARPRDRELADLLGRAWWNRLLFWLVATLCGWYVRRQYRLIGSDILEPIGERAAPVLDAQLDLMRCYLETDSEVPDAWEGCLYVTIEYEVVNPKRQDYSGNPLSIEYSLHLSPTVYFTADGKAFFGENMFFSSRLQERIGDSAAEYLKMHRERLALIEIMMMRQAERHLAEHREILRKQAEEVLRKEAIAAQQKLGELTEELRRALDANIESPQRATNYQGVLTRLENLALNTAPQTSAAG